MRDACHILFIQSFRSFGHHLHLQIHGVHAAALSHLLGTTHDELMETILLYVS
jgi:hypothetical protein